jgi:hypothetical protein
MFFFYPCTHVFLARWLLHSSLHMRIFTSKTDGREETTSLVDVKAVVFPLPVSFPRPSSLKILESQNHVLLRLFFSGGFCSLPPLLFFTMDFTKPGGNPAETSPR